MEIDTSADSSQTAKADPAAKSDPSANDTPSAKSDPSRNAGSQSTSDSQADTRPAESATSTIPPSTAPPSTAPPTAAPPTAGVAQSSAVVRGLKAAAGAVARSPARTAKLIGALLLVVIIVQNGEPTGIDVLFWSIPPVPKLVLMLICMVIGAVTWEILRRSRRRDGDRAPKS